MSEADRDPTRPGGAAAQTAREAAEVALAYANATTLIWTEYRSEPALAPLLDQMLSGAHRTEAYTGHDRARDATLISNGLTGVDLLYIVAYTAAAVEQWRRHQVVYRMHPELVTALGDTDLSTPVPCELFRSLPHPDPFVVFPAPIPIARPAGALLPMAADPLLVGMLITGRTATGELRSTADPTATALNVFLAARVHYCGEAPNYEEHTLCLPLTGTATVTELIRRDQVRSAPSSFAALRSDDAEAAAFQLAVTVLLYLCSDGRDIRERTAPPAHPKAKKAKVKRRPAEPTVHDVGHTIGPALFAAREAHRATTPAGGTATRTPVRAHLRRAHWHTYWTGPRSGQQTPALRWLHPTLVNPEGTVSAGPVVIDASPPNFQRA